jgi:hypothetical protein
MLCIGLIVNGSGYALASAGMPMSMAKVGLGNHAPGASNTSGSAKGAQPPCHEPAAGTESVADTNQINPRSHASDPSAAADQGAPDCCKSGNCRCACVHQLPVFVAADWVRDAVVVHVDNARSMRSTHASPTLPHLIRPPIG